MNRNFFLGYTLLAPTSTSLNTMLNTCKQYTGDVKLTFNARKVNCMCIEYTSSRKSLNNIVCLYEFVSKMQLLDIYERHISGTVR